MSWVPNAITALRLALLPVFGWYVVDDRPITASVVLALIGFSDVLDGYLARKWNVMSRLGAFLDPLADKLAQITGLIGRDGKPHFPCRNNRERVAAISGIETDRPEATHLDVRVQPIDE